MEDQTEAGGRDGLGRRERLLRRLARALDEPVVPVLVLASFFDLISGDPVVHGTLLFTVALALGIDAFRKRRAVRIGAGGGEAPAVADERSWFGRAGDHLRLSPVALVAGLFYVIVVGTFSRYSWPASIAVFTPAAIGVAFAWRRPSIPVREGQKIERSGALVWAGAFVTFGLWELTNLFLQPSLTKGSQAHPTISVLMNPVLASQSGRSLFLAAWLAFGLFLLERAR